MWNKNKNSSKKKERFRKPFRPYQIGIHWIALAEYSQMCQGFNHFQGFSHNFVLAK